MLVAEAIRLLRGIEWKSVEKDNMEYVTKVSCYQVDALNMAIEALEQKSRNFPGKSAKIVDK